MLLDICSLQADTQKVTFWSCLRQSRQTPPRLLGEMSSLVQFLLEQPPSSAFSSRKGSELCCLLSKLLRAGSEEVEDTRQIKVCGTD